MSRKTVIFTDRSEKALSLLMEGGTSITDAVNQSVQKSAYLEWKVNTGGKVIIQDPDGTQRELVFSYKIPGDPGVPR